MATTTPIPRALSVGNGDPIDRRLLLSKEEMLNMKDVKMPRSDIQKYFALCIDDNQFYVYDKNATPNAETGKFSRVTSFQEAATEDTAGLVKSSKETNSISVNSDGTMKVNEVSVTKLVNEEGFNLVLDGGSAPLPGKLR